MTKKRNRPRLRLSQKEARMGKKGDLLRAQKKQTKTYVFTAEQLEEHDRQVKAAYKEYALERLADDIEKVRKEAEKVETENILKVWHRREREFKEGAPVEILANCLKYAFAISCNVMIRDFGWKVRKSSAGRKANIERFAEALAREFNAVTDSDVDGVAEYADRVRKEFGIYFLREGDRDPYEGDSTGTDDNPACDG